ncbi:RNA-directed RNA polymerase [ssRNA phage SRR6255733_1]|uniref:RNA-directed RNA polymerase n=1 Tax=ssRNA phage SRR6255733_1 TaxID=2786497 RepID=A0A8S5L1H5_9VIRU|nr:RNA-directed RNA polymerase [ssRNA phage SRR6255733_1]DAD50954.1 TPA_asm: RNA-directed RNA polymerase [ssRNA phage SRR6255733_1]
MRKKVSRRTRHESNANFSYPTDLSTTFLDKLRGLSRSFKTDYLFSEILSKFVSSDTAPEKVRRTRAINKWLGAEANNEQTNVRLMTVDLGFNILPRVTYEKFMRKVSDIVITIIGETPPEDVLNGSFSGGASTSRSRTYSHPAKKYEGLADVTIDALPLLQEITSHYLWGLFPYDEVRVVEGNVLFTVPKSTDIDRCACKEPDINMYLQKGVGSYFRKKLTRFGIDLTDQSKNRNLARRGSLDGSLATIDLSSASDSISRELVFQVLPITWFAYLDSIRSKTTMIDSELHVCEMFSSMGNGFTFELQTIIYYSIARAVSYFTGEQGVISVYGDDIIVPSGVASDLIFVLTFLGFNTNTDKTFIDGPFRESCGGHFVNGHDVTPFYIRKPISDLHTCITIANQLRRWAECEGSEILDPEVEDSWQYLANQIPKCFWGGHDTNDSSHLTSYWRPKSPKKLTQVTGKPVLTNIGGYLWWHDTRDTNPTSSIDSSGWSSYKLPLGRYRSTKRKDLQRVRSVFLHELLM